MQKRYPINYRGTVIGVGIGPANLSLAALLTKLNTRFSYFFFEEKKAFSWHKGLLLPDATLQTSFLEDLVTPVDPTNPYSFLSFLVKMKRFYRFIYANFRRITRLEFNEYLEWVSQSIPQLFFNEAVLSIDFDSNKNRFVIETNHRRMFGTHVVLGSGIEPYFPPFTYPYLGRRVFHSSKFIEHGKDYAGKRIAVIGGGQSSAEIINTLISNSNQLPSELYWISRRPQFAQLDESPFIYELFSPNFMQYFYHLEHLEKRNLLNKYSLANDGITLKTLEAIYQSLYSLELLQRQQFFYALVNHRLLNIKPASTGVTLEIIKSESVSPIYKEVDMVIFCTGYHRPFPKYLIPLREKIHYENSHIYLNEDYSIEWDGPDAHRIYIQNGGAHSHGLGDTSLCLLAYRSAAIINSLAGHMLYNIENNSTVIKWSHTEEQYNGGNKHAINKRDY